MNENRRKKQRNKKEKNKSDTDWHWYVIRNKEVSKENISFVLPWEGSKSSVLKKKIREKKIIYLV